MLVINFDDYAGSEPVRSVRKELIRRPYIYTKRFAVCIIPPARYHVAIRKAAELHASMRTVLDVCTTVRSAWGTAARFVCSSELLLSMVP